MKLVMAILLMLFLPLAAASGKGKPLSCRYETQQYVGGEGWIVVELSEPCNQGKQEDTIFRHEGDVPSDLMNKLVATGNYQHIIIVGKTITLQLKSDTSPTQTKAELLRVLSDHFNKPRLKCEDKVRKNPPHFLIQNK